ncbi:diguanylate cyclase domain-containing protein [Pseudaeromonas sharmana]|uniref:Diguanylate cyclase domain-containing protein n=1 Tax=Pseudaeromonas sharmana TaxID=328412 RepID=A0ABV8CIW5_9GAMM
MSVRDPYQDASAQQLVERIEALQRELAHLSAYNAELCRENQLLLEKLNAALDGTGLCLWQGMVQSGELTVFNLQNFQRGDMAPHFDVWQAKLHPEDKQYTLDCYYGHLQGTYAFYEAEYRTVAADGQITWLWDRGRVIERDGQGKPLRVMGAHIDITQRKEYERRLALQADSDALTGLHNRQAFSRLVQARMKNPVPGALLFIDLDDFKVINDQLGHARGDRVLLQVAEWLQRMVPDGAICGRYGGDEFVVYLDTNVSLPQVSRLAEQLLTRSAVYEPEQGCNLHVGMSIGIALWQRPPTFLQGLEAADRAMYQAKQQGKLGYQWINM